MTCSAHHRVRCSASVRPTGSCPGLRLLLWRRPRCGTRRSGAVPRRSRGRGHGHRRRTRGAPSRSGSGPSGRGRARWCARARSRTRRGSGGARATATGWSGTQGPAGTPRGSAPGSRAISRGGRRQVGPARSVSWSAESRESVRASRVVSSCSEERPQTRSRSVTWSASRCRSESVVRSAGKLLAEEGAVCEGWGNQRLHFLATFGRRLGGHGQRATPHLENAQSIVESHVDAVLRHQCDDMSTHCRLDVQHWNSCGAEGSDETVLKDWGRSRHMGICARLLYVTCRSLFDEVIRERVGTAAVTMESVEGDRRARKRRAD